MCILRQHKTYLDFGVGVVHFYHALRNVYAHRLANPVTKCLPMLASFQRTKRKETYPRQETGSAGVIQQASAVGNTNKVNLLLQLALDGTKRLLVSGIIVGSKFTGLVSGAARILLECSSAGMAYLKCSWLAETTSDMVIELTRVCWMQVRGGGEATRRVQAARRRMLKNSVN